MTRYRAVRRLLSLPIRRRPEPHPQRKREKLFEALLRQLEPRRASRPVLVVFEDAHWIDPTSRELLDLTVDRVGTAGPAGHHLPARFQPPWRGRPQVTRWHSTASANATARPWCVAGRHAALAGDMIDEIVERTDGVPLFVEELTKAVLESAAQDDRVAAVLASGIAGGAGGAGDSACLADGPARPARAGGQGDGADRRRARPRVRL